MKCFLCENQVDEKITCLDCGELVCEDCLTSFTIQNQIDYDKCLKCHGIDLEEKADFEIRKEKAQELKEKERLEKNRKKRVYYNSPAQVEKRRIAKIEERERKNKRFIQDFEHMKDLFNF